MQKLISLLLVLIISTSTWSQTTTQDYEFLARAQTIVIQNSEFIRLDLEKKLIKVFTDSPELLTANKDEEVNTLIEQLVSKELPNKAKIKLDVTLKNFVLGSIKETRTIIRKYGLGIGITYSAISLANYAAMFIFTATGQVQAAAIAAALPAGTIFLVTSIAVMNVAKHGKMIKMYGGKTNYKYYKNLSKQVQKNLKLKGKKGLIIPLEKFTEDSYLSITVANNNLWQKIADFIDHDRSKLSYKQLKYFLQKHHAWDKSLENINAKDLDDELKIGLVLTMVKAKDLLLFQKIQEQFPGSFVQVAEFVFSQELKEWILAAANAQDRQELIHSVQMIPKHARVIDILKIWTKTIVPHLLENGKNLTYKGYRNLSKSIDHLNVQAELNAHKLVDEKWKNDFNQYLLDALDLAVTTEMSH